MALVATVLLTVVAASIVLVILRQSLLSTRTASVRYDMTTAATVAEAGRASLESKLASDPDFFLSEVHVDERARVCTALPAQTVVQPGSTWPAECGSTWAYQEPNEPHPSGVQGVQLELVAPSPSNPDLRARLLARTGDIETGMDVTYRFGDAGEFTIWSADALDLGSVPGSTETHRFSGRLYSVGPVTAPQSAAVALDSAQLATESGFTSPPTNSAARYYGPTPQDSSPPIRDVRRIVTAPHTANAMQGTLGALRSIACPATPAVAVDGGAGAPFAGALTSLCLTEGAVIPNTAGTAVTVPAGVESWLVLTGPAGTNTVRVLYSTQLPRHTTGCPTAAACDLPGLASSEVSGGFHPGALAYWTSLGDFRLPTSGVIATSADTHIGLCSNGFLSSAGTCATHSGSAPGMQVAQAVTVVAGTYADPADVYLSGPVHATDDGVLAVVASGAAHVPYWARPPQANLALDVDVTALGLGNPFGSPFRAMPSTLAAPTGAGDPSWAGQLHISGSVSTRWFDPVFPGFRTVRVEGPGAAGLERAPWASQGSSTWVRQQSRRVTAAQVCGARNCDDAEWTPWAFPTPSP